MRVVTTASKQGLAEYGHRWLESRKYWPKGTEFWWYTEGYELPYAPAEQQMIDQAGCGDTEGWLERCDILAVEPFVAWRAKHIGYQVPDYRFDVVKFAHKVFAAADAFYDYDGIGVWLDADCVTYAQIPDGLIEKQVADAYLACYQRTGLYTETGLWIMNCAHPEHKNFLDYWRELYYSEHYRKLAQWHDCCSLDATIKAFGNRITVNNLSGAFSRHSHPQAMTELGKYCDHLKGPRKIGGFSPENKQRALREV
jgi:hypothetical protein